jgi:NAD(P)-dependent dehydrogenase (short-subunit alcohol dehydrogenase family)
MVNHQEISFAHFHLDICEQPTIFIVYRRMAFEMEGRKEYGMKGVTKDGIPNMYGKTCLVTGANSGLGFETSMTLAMMGAKVVMVCRNKERGEEAKLRIINATGNKSVDLLIADLSSQTQVKKLAEQFKSRSRRLDVLINNAGRINYNLCRNPDGIEITFATNYLGHFLLTHLLIEKLLASAPARIINISSSAHALTKGIEYEHLRMIEGLAPMQAYAQSKLAVVMFTYELARRLASRGVTVNAVDPGVVNTNFGRGATGFLKVLMWILINIFGLPQKKGAETTVWLATANELEGVTGKYFRYRKALKSSPNSYDRQAWRKLWKTSDEMTSRTRIHVPRKLVETVGRLWSITTTLQKDDSRTLKSDEIDAS